MTNCFLWDVEKPDPAKFEFSTLKTIPVENSFVYREPGRFGGWPANNGVWIWENEVVVGFSLGYHNPDTTGGHALRDDKPELKVLSRSLDGGQTWSHPSILLPQKGFMGKTQPIQLQAGKIIIPIYNEEQFCPFVMILNDMENLQNQKIVAETMARGIALQPVVTELESDKLLMLCRTNKGKIWGSYSYNGGLSWSILSPTLIPNPNSAIDLIQTNTAELILAFNNSQTNRYSLSISLSMDKGKSWSSNAITKDSQYLNVRPVFPRGYVGQKDHLLWMNGDYIHFTDYATRITMMLP